MKARTILHADMDAFYAAIEQRENESLRGKPVIVGGLGRRGVVSTGSYEARAFGVHSAMPIARARRLCPDGIFLSPRMQLYSRVGAQVREIFASFTPLFEPLSLDEAFLDVTQSHALFGTGEEIAALLKESVKEQTGLSISVGVAGCKFVAKVASDLDKPDGLVVVPPGQEIAFLGPLPVSRLWGAGRVTQERMQRSGLRHIADLQALSAEQLVSILGEAGGRHYHALCRGLDDRPVQPERAVQSISHEITFDEDLHSGAACRRHLLRLSEAVGRRLRRAGLEGRVVKLKLRFPPFETRLRQATLAAPTSDDLSIHRAVLALLERARPSGRPVRLLGVGVSGLVAANEPGRAQGELFAAEPNSEQTGNRVMEAIDRIRDRFGEDAIHHGGTRE